MTGIIYVEGATLEATSGHMLVCFTSGGDSYRFRLPAHVALTFRQKILADGWQVACAPDAETVSLAARRARARRDKQSHAT